MRHETDESAPSGQSRVLIPLLEWGMRLGAIPHMPTMLAQTTRSRPVALSPSSSTSPALKSTRPGATSGAAGQAFLAMPFDALRFQYASAVMAGLAQRSIIASGKLERALDALEKLILGPLARQR